MWPFSTMSLESASFWGTIANWSLVACLVGGVVSTFAIVKTTDVKEEHWANDRQRSKEHIARLNAETARLTADNLALQTALLPRHVGLIGFDGPPPAKEWFAGFQRWAGTKILIQVVVGDPEAQNVANEIAIVLSKFGWLPEFIDEKRSGISLNLSEGIQLFSPSSHKAWDESDPIQQKFAKLSEASQGLAVALTKAGLGVGEYPVSNAGLVVDFPADSEAAASQYGKFSQPLEGLYLQVGSRPVGATVAWIKRGRPDRLGNIQASPPDTAPHN
jgi:hypothetical protein